MDTERKQQLEQFIQVLGLKEFHNLLVLDQALTHSSTPMKTRPAMAITMNAWNF